MSHLESRERRYFPRANYRAHATLMTAEKRYPVHILDLSFNGALAALIHKHNLQAGEAVVLTIEMDDGDPIKMQGHLAHQQEHFLGIECHATNIDHQARLRDLLQRNSDNERSLRTLINDHDRPKEQQVHTATSDV